MVVDLQRRPGVDVWKEKYSFELIHAHKRGQVDPWNPKKQTIPDEKKKEEIYSFESENQPTPQHPVVELEAREQVRQGDRLDLVDESSDARRSVHGADQFVGDEVLHELVLALRYLVEVSAVCIKGQAFASDVPCNLHVVPEAALHPVSFVSFHDRKLGLVDRVHAWDKVRRDVGIGEGSVGSIVVLEREAVVGVFDDADQDAAASLAVRADPLLLWGLLGDFCCLPMVDHTICDLFASWHVVRPLTGHGSHIAGQGGDDDADIVHPGVEVLRGGKAVVFASLPLTVFEARSDELLNLALVGRHVLLCALKVYPHGLLKNDSHFPYHSKRDFVE